MNQYLYSKEILKKRLILTISQLGLNTFFFIRYSEDPWLRMLFPLCALIFIYSYFREKTKAYIIIKKNNLLIQSFFWYKNINLENYSDVYKNENNIYLKDKNNRKKISTWQIDKTTKDRLFTEINNIINNI